MTVRFHPAFGSQDRILRSQFWTWWTLWTQRTAP